MRPKISIIIPAYNSSFTILDTLESVKKQTYDNFECIIVNDGSIDDTVKKIETHYSNDKRLILIDQNNTGPYQARLNGVSIATGEWITFLDSDDTLELDALENYVNNINENIDIIVSSLKTSNDKNNNYIEINDYRHTLYCGFSIPLALHGKLFRSSLFENLQFSIPKYLTSGEDLILNLLLAFKTNKKVLYISNKIYNYYINLGGLNITTKYTPELQLEFDSLKWSTIPKYLKNDFIKDHINARFVKFDRMGGWNNTIPEEWKNSDWLKQLKSDVKETPALLSRIKTWILFSEPGIKKRLLILIRKFINKFPKEGFLFKYFNVT